MRKLESKNEKIDFDKVSDSEKNLSMEEDVTIDNIGKKYIKHPGVGEETGEFTIEKVVRSRDIKRTDSAGNSFTINLSGVDFAYVFKTNRGEYRPATWEVVNKIIAVAKLHEKNDLKDFKVNVKHVMNAFTDKTKKGEAYEVYDCNVTPPVKVEI
jgi:hypothetical protein